MNAVAVANELVKIFSRTLKNMLHRFVDQEKHNWAKLLPYLLFAVREVPQSSTGISPFELLYSRQPRGILDLIREGWEEQSKESKNVVKYVLQLRDRLELVGRLAHDNLKAAQQKQQQSYNKNARIRNFRPGDKVLLLLPSSESKLFAKWQGPFQVIRAIGKVNYEIRQPGRRKESQIYHVNLLKPWKEREVHFISPVQEGEDFGPSIESESAIEVPMGEQLTPDQREEVSNLIKMFSDVFSNVPGRTHLIEHAIITPPGLRVRQRPYRIPESRRDSVRREVECMLKLGVIEPSRSEWCSPILPIDKPGGSL
ncbi:NYNRI protein, partial [Polyodon spathula]|nr:NYNRI protein [Polyodon spathula]